MPRPSRSGHSPPESGVRLAVVGTGLIGASVGLAATRAAFGPVVGWDEDPAALEVAAEREAVAPRVSLADALADAELALVAVPVARLASTLREVLELVPSGCTVTDVGSTKGAVCAEVGADPRFVGGHPICGAETQGPARANAELFDEATWLLTPLPATPP